MSSRARAAVTITALLCATLLSLAVVGLIIGPTPAPCSSTVEVSR